MKNNNILSFLLCLVLIGCATSSKKVTFLKDPGALQPGRHLDGIWVASGFNPRNYPTVVIGAHATVKAPPGEVDVEYYSDYLKKTTASHLRGTRFFKEVFEDVSPTPPSHGVLKCELVITQYDPGSRLVRWWASEFGFGHATIQVEGRITDFHTGKELLTFLESRRGAAALDPTGGDPKLLIEQDFREIALNLSQELSSL